MTKDFQMIYEIKVNYDIENSDIVFYLDDQTISKITKRTLNKVIKKIKYFLKDVSENKIEEKFSDECYQFDVMLKLDKDYEKKLKQVGQKIDQILWEHPLSVTSYQVKVEYKMKSISNI